MRKRVVAFCLACFLTGYLAPWSFILVGGVVGAFSEDPYWRETATWLLAVGFILLGVSYLFARMYNRFIYDQR